MLKTFPFLILMIVLFAVASAAQKPSPSKPVPTAAPSPNKAPAYDDIVAKLKAGDTSIDFKSLRLAYAETKDAHPFGADRELRKSMFAALDEDRYKDAIKAADKILETGFVNMNAHIVKAIACREMADQQEYDFHKAIYNGLVDSILTGADGKTGKTAYVVISTEEEYVIMQALDYAPSGQALVREDGHTFDVLNGTDKKTKQPVKVYFNIDIVWAAEMKMFSK